MIEELILNYLRENGFSCYMSMPENPSGNFCILEKTGDSRDEGIYTATLALQSYGSSDHAAAQLNHRVVQAMLDADTLPEIISCDLVTEYNFPDTTRKRPRYQAVFSVTHY
nr:MAG TPA: tail completion protein [Caudoviricetes sp.]